MDYFEPIPVKQEWSVWRKFRKKTENEKVVLISACGGVNNPYLKFSTVKSKVEPQSLQRSLRKALKLGVLSALRGKNRRMYGREI